jgi:hypothetical protein
VPIASFRAWVGFAKAGAPTYLTASVAAAATSLPVSGTVVPASSTVYIVDGTKSETATVTAGGGSSTLTVAAIANAHPANTPIYWQLTASLGPAAWIPVTNATPTDHIVYIDDTGFRGSNVAAYNSVPATAHAEVGIDGDVFTDAFGFVLGSVYGAVDFSAGTPNSHTFAGMNTAASNGQPTPMLLFVYNGGNVRLFPGAKCSEVQIKFDPATNLSYTSKWMSLESMVVANYTPTFTSVAPQGAWQAATSINSVTVPNTLTADFTIKRDAIEAIQTLDGSQQATVVWAGPLSTTGNLNLTYEDDTNLNFFLNGAPIPVSFTLVNGTGATQSYFNLQMTKCLFVDGWTPNLTGGKGYVEVGGPVTAVSNTTDANTAGGGYSPSRSVLKNTLATGTYQ